MTPAILIPVVCVVALIAAAMILFGSRKTAKGVAFTGLILGGGLTAWSSYAASQCTGGDHCMAGAIGALMLACMTGVIAIAGLLRMLLNWWRARKTS